MAKQARRAVGNLSEQERARYQSMRKQIEAEKPEILAQARLHKAAHDSAAAALREAFVLLKAERVAQGLSLADVQDRTGIGRSALSRLENDAEANPTVATLTRYAEAVGKKLVIKLVDR